MARLALLQSSRSCQAGGCPGTCIAKQQKQRHASLSSRALVQASPRQWMAWERDARLRCLIRLGAAQDRVRNRAGGHAAADAGPCAARRRVRQRNAHRHRCARLLLEHGGKPVMGTEALHKQKVVARMIRQQVLWRASAVHRRRPLRSHMDRCQAVSRQATRGGRHAAGQLVRTAVCQVRDLRACLQREPRAQAATPASS